ncbi:MAG: YbgC/FadM family acyl-CoA thioesterase [Proteobacteria bacterium]|nr:YbgC/FadM family acyl-CoA thioesterase [Pseudomonadota bacterium]
MNQKELHFEVQVYYEDTDHSGVVYHANYLKYFERAREHAIGTKELSRMWHEEGIGFAVYKIEIGYFEGAVFGDSLDIRSTCRKDGDYKIVWTHEAWRPGSKKAAVKATLELVCLDKGKRLIPIPKYEPSQG